MKKTIVISFFLASATILFANQTVDAQEERTGLIFEGFGLNHLQITNVNYFGDCPGFSQRTVKTYFTDSSTSADKDLKVKVINKTEGVNPEKPPSKETSYKKDNLSSSFSTRSSTRDDFGVMNGLNIIEYQIFNRKTKDVVKKGSFEIEAKIMTIDEPRSANWRSEEQICLKGFSVSSCEPGYLAWKSNKVCPDGRIVDTQTRTQKRWF